MATAIRKLHRTQIQGRTVSVEKTKSNKEEREQVGYTVHVNNLSFKVTEDDLRQYCEENFGGVKKVHLVRDEKGNSKGFAFVEFDNE